MLAQATVRGAQSQSCLLTFSDLQAKSSLRTPQAQNKQFDVLGELAATAAHEQPQQRRERKIGE